MTELTFTTPLGVAELVIPLLSVGVFPPGISLFSYMLHKAPIDDFGKGYSSFAYLRHLAIDSLKLDREIVTEITTSNSGCWSKLDVHSSGASSSVAPGR